MKIENSNSSGLDWTNHHGPDYNRAGLPAFRCLETSSPKTKIKTKIKNGGAVMKKSLFGCILMVLIGGSFASSVIAGDTLVRFKGAIGDIPVANVAGTPNPDGSFPDVIQNIVRGVEPAGQIWVISDFKADVKVDGRISVDGRGLLLGGGNAIGTNGNANVFATLICEATPPFVEHSTNITGVPLEANGDFRIDDALLPAPPAQCGSPVLLIRVSPPPGVAMPPSPPWFAAGIPKN
jgi:hypothetical protein